MNNPGSPHHNSNNSNTNSMQKIKQVILVLASLLLTGYSIIHFHEALSILDLGGRMIDKHVVEQKALEMAKQRFSPCIDGSNHSVWVDPPPKGNCVAAVSFVDHTEERNLMDREWSMKVVHHLQQQFHIFNQWKVRVYRVGYKEEVYLIYSPFGDLIGMERRLDEEINPGESLNEEEAKALAEQMASQWNMSIEGMLPLDSGRHMQPSGRVVWTFKYEMKNYSKDEGGVRLQLQVCGEEVTMIQRHVYIGERYESNRGFLRMLNTILASVASVPIFLLLIVRGLGLSFWSTLDVIDWRIGGTGVVLGILRAFARWSLLPSSWMEFGTDQHPWLHLISLLINGLHVASLHIVLFSIVFAIGEAIYRKAFAFVPSLHDLVQWRGWNTLWESTWYAYAFTGILFGYEMWLYEYARKKMGWWVPSSSNTDPSILENYQAWLTPTVNALQAGVLEEVLFRIIPLSLETHRKGYVKSMCVLQGIMFAAAHANYDTEPGYARLAELLSPGILWGVLFLKQGAFVCILTHFLYDLVWMAMPLFVGMSWIDAIGFVGPAFLLSVITLRYTWKRIPMVISILVLCIVSNQLVHAAFAASVVFVMPMAIQAVAFIMPEEEKEPMKIPPLPSLQVLRPSFSALRPSWWWMPLGMAALAVGKMMLHSPFPDNSVTRAQALEIAHPYWSNESQWTIVIDARSMKSELGALEYMDSVGEMDTWLEAGMFRPLRWVVTHNRLGQDIAYYNRTQHQTVVIDGSTGQVLRVQRHDPDHWTEVELDATQARQIALEGRRKWWKGNDTMEEVRSTPKALHQRTDWHFVWRWKKIEGAEGLVHVKLTGDKVTDFYTSVQLSDIVLREQKRTRKWKVLLVALAKIPKTIIFPLLLVIQLMKQLQKNPKSIFASWKWLLGVFLALLLVRANEYPLALARFNPVSDLSSSVAEWQSSLLVEVLAQWIKFAMFLFLYHKKESVGWKGKAPWIGVLWGVLTIALAGVSEWVYYQDQTMHTLSTFVPLADAIGNGGLEALYALLVLHVLQTFVPSAWIPWMVVSIQSSMLGWGAVSWMMGGVVMALFPENAVWILLGKQATVAWLSGNGWRVLGVAIVGWLCA